VLRQLETLVMPQFANTAPDDHPGRVVDVGITRVTEVKTAGARLLLDEMLPALYDLGMNRIQDGETGQEGSAHPWNYPAVHTGPGAARANSVRCSKSATIWE
jgi:hypothetical protein